MSSSYGHHAAGGPSPGGQASFHPRAYSNNSSLSSLKDTTQAPSQHMGSSHSKASNPAPSPSSSSFKGLSAAVTGGIGFKRVFASKRKKSEDLLAKSAEHALSRPLSTSQILNINSKTSVVQQPSSPPPPIPPKCDKRPPSLLHGEQSKSPNRASILPISPGISPAVNYMLQQQQSPISPVAKSPISEPQPQSQQSAPEAEKVKLPSIPDNVEMKESWRKSDSTNSHTTVRPGGNGGSTRTSRPVSWAESFQSTHTVVQASNKRLSALITDGMPEEDDESFVSCGDNSGSHPSESNPSSSHTLKHRRSISLNLASSTNRITIPPQLASASMTELKHSFSPVVSPSSTLDTQSFAPTQKLTLAHVPPSSMSFDTDADRPPQTSVGNNFRGRLATWASTNLSSDNVSRQDRTLPAIPLEQRRPSLPHFAGGDGMTLPSTSTPSSSRQTTISMTASGLAAGLAKRAVEKMGKRWGISLSPSTSGSGSGYSSSSSSTNAPSSFSSASHPDYGLVRTSSNRSSVHSHIVRSSHSHGSAVGLAGGGGKRGTPDASSGVYSADHVASKSDTSAFVSSGPFLGTMLRGRLRDKNGVVTSKVVFGRELRIVTMETGINVGKRMESASVDGGKVKEGLILELEGRLLPAVVVRCAQHLLIWGVQEEGLFRVSGRPSHVSKLRSEFDSGVDYDMTECSPGDLDPHAVASVFKAYLRELPESILTRALSPLFDVAIKKEAFTNLSSPEHNRFSGVGRENIGNAGLPQGPKSGFSMRKPPSLSTLSMPTFSGIPPPSTSLVADIKSLVSQLPRENYDLLRTVVDLIKATGKESTMTKMPLSNMLLVFCPSLNMTPPLLKIFCETEDIWADVMDSPSPPPLPSKAGQFVKREEADMTYSSEENDEEDEVEEKSLMSSGRASLDTTDDPSSGYHASAEEEASLFEGQFMRRQYPPERKTERSEIPTIYLDTMSHYSSSSGSSLRESLEPSGRHYHHRTDSKDSTDDGSLSPASGLVPPVLSLSTPACSSSVESVVSLTSEVSDSFSQLPAWNDSREGGGKINEIGPVEIVDPDPIPISSAPTTTPAKKTSIGHPSPTNDDDAMQTSQLPNPPSARQRRISIPVLSLPNFSPPFLMSSGDADRLKDDDSPCPSPISGVNMLNKKSKRPSLRLLFSKNKKSGSSLNSLGDRSGEGLVVISNPIQQRLPHSPAWDSGTSDSSGSTPHSAVTAASGTSSLSHLPPVLDTPIDGSPLSLDMGHDSSPPETAIPDLAQHKFATSPTSTVTTLTPSLSVDKSTNLEDVIPPTPGASRVSTISEEHSSLTIPHPSTDKLLHPAQRSSPSLETPSSDSPQLSLLDNVEDEDWTQSVLSAANKL